MIFKSLIILPFFLFTTAIARPWGINEIERPMSDKYVPIIVKWFGEVKEEISTHDSTHDFLFFNKDDGKSYKIVDSPDFFKFKHEIGKNYLVEVEAEITPIFLFWGGNLIVKKFQLIGDSKIEESDPSKQSLI
jgi:hypothetical protein